MRIELPSPQLNFLDQLAETTDRWIEIQKKFSWELFLPGDWFAQTLQLGSGFGVDILPKQPDNNGWYCHPNATELGPFKSLAKAKAAAEKELKRRVG